MDPTATLLCIGLCLRQGDPEEVIEACVDLQAWLGKGGFAPEWEADPKATHYFRAWFGAGA